MIQRCWTIRFLLKQRGLVSELSLLYSDNAPRDNVLDPPYLLKAVPDAHLPLLDSITHLQRHPHQSYMKFNTSPANENRPR